MISVTVPEVPPPAPPGKLRLPPKLGKPPVPVPVGVRPFAEASAAANGFVVDDELDRQCFCVSIPPTTSSPTWRGSAGLEMSKMKMPALAASGQSGEFQALG